MKKLFALMTMATLVLAAAPALAECDPPCGDGKMCVDDVCVPDLSCETDADCLEGEVCVDAICMPDYSCLTDDDCMEGEVCVEGMCVPDVEPDCVTDDDCLAGETCVEGVCVPEEPDCATDAECAEGEICVEGECVPDGGCAGCAPWQSCVVDTCTDPGSQGTSPYGGDYIAGECWDTDYNGCCANEVLYYCDDQSGQCPLGASCLVMIDCGANGTTCSWDAESGFFNCLQGLEAPLPDDSGNLYCSWYDCEGSCEGKVCGNDGCGGSCGDCADGEGCTQAGQCAGCDTVCAGFECGDVGGCDCGTCDGGLQCVGGMCVAGDTCAGACGGQSAAGCYCDEGCVDYGDCCPDVCDMCPELSHCGECVPSCDGKICGDDGCGASCGDCADGEGCTEAGDACVPATCEGYCGQTTATPAGCFCDTECEDFDDCCPDRCDFCPEVCTDNPCAAACVGKCGALGDCDCGECADGEVCVANICGGPCVPDCTDLVCGDDGCGGSCGDCAGGEICDMGACIIDIGEDVVAMPCDDDTDCVGGEYCNANGQCEAIGGGDDGGDGGLCATGDSVPTAGLIVLFGILGLAVIRRRAIV